MVSPDLREFEFGEVLPNFDKIGETLCLEHKVSELCNIVQLFDVYLGIGLRFFSAHKSEKDDDAELIIVGKMLVEQKRGLFRDKSRVLKNKVKKLSFV